MPERPKDPPYLILAVEESASSLAFYDPESGKEVGRVALSLWPHEIAVASDGLAYVSNFGVRDYDLSLGYAGNSVSVVDVAARAEIGRLFTKDGSQKYWAPHGVKVSPDENHVYVNVERVLGTREPDLERPGSEFTKLLKFERSSGACVAELSIPIPEFDRGGADPDRAIAAYDVIPGTHNFVFSPHDPNELWLFSGRAGVSVFNVEQGLITHRLQSFNGAVRSLSFGPSGNLLVSATNEVSLVDPVKKTIIWKYGGFGVGQILYSTLTPDESFVLAPAVWEGQVLVVSTKDGTITHSLSTGIDPVQVVVSPDGARAYVTHGRTQWLSYIDLADLSKVSGRIMAKGGPNGIAFAPWSSPAAQSQLTLATCLPFTGSFSAEGRELRLGYQHWQDRVNASGGILVDGKPMRVEIAYADSGSSLDAARLTSSMKTLISKEGPAAILGSYPSAADGLLGKAATDLGIPYVSGVGTDSTLFASGNGLAFSLAHYGSCRLEGVLKAVRTRLSPFPKHVAVLAANRPDHLAEAASTIAFAKKLGFSIISSSGGDEPFVHEVGGSDLDKLVSELHDLIPDLLLVIDDAKDAILVVQSMANADYRPGGIGLACDITNPATLEKLGTLADGLMGATPWVPPVIDFAEDRFGSGADFSRGYFNEFSEMASGLAAAGCGVGVVLETALMEGCSLNQLPAALSGLSLDSFYTSVAFDANGRNRLHSPIAVQMMNKAHAITAEVIWPIGLTDRQRPVWPY